MTTGKTLHDNVKSGDLAAVQALLAADPSLLGSRNEAGQDPILLSKYYGRHEITTYLLSLQPEMDVFTAAAVGDAAFVIREVERDPALLAAHSSDGWTPLHLAAFFGNAELALRLIEQGAEVDARSTNSMTNTPLHAATAGRKTGVVLLLLNEGADANARQHGGWTPLHGAAQNGDRDTVEVLIAHGADLNARADNNQTALDLALQKGHSGIAGLLDGLGVHTE